MTRIRAATHDDVSAIGRMAERFLRETRYAAFMQPDVERLTRSVESFIDAPDRIVLVAEARGTVIGMIALLVYEHPFSGDRLAFEVCWWTEPESRGAGVRLLRAAEAWAQKHSTVGMQMVAPTERVGAFYERVGYVPVETSYQRMWQTR